MKTFDVVKISRLMSITGVITFLSKKLDNYSTWFYSLDNVENDSQQYQDQNYK
jgi:hypothetical protein